MTDLARRASATGAATPAPRPIATRTVGPNTGHWWFAVTALTVLLASDYKFRVRDPRQSLQSQIDIAIVIEIAAYSLVALFLVARNPHRLRIKRLPAPMLAAWALLTVMLLAVPRAPNLSVELVRGFEMVVIVSIAMTLFQRGGRYEVHLFLHGFLAVVAASVIFGVVHPMPRFASQQDRFTWLRIHPVTSAVFVGVATLIAAAYLMQRRAERPGPRWPTSVYAVLGLIVAGGLYATKTRGAVLGTVLGLLVLTWLVTRGRQRVELFVLLVVAIIGFALAASSQIIAYIQRGESAQQLASLNSRTELWDVAWSFIRQKPLYGYGLGASHSLFLDATGLGGAHNALVNVLVDLGIFGTIVWALVIVTTLATALRSNPADPGIRLERGLLVALMALLMVNGVSNGGLGDEANVASTLMFLLAAWACVIRRAAGPKPASRRRLRLFR